MQPTDVTPPPLKTFAIHEASEMVLYQGGLYLRIDIRILKSIKIHHAKSACPEVKRIA